jgi:histidine triad (HIT) family protein
VPNNLNRFTSDARRVLTLAQEEARRLNHRLVGPEHLLLGLVRVPDSAAVRIFHQQAVEPGQVIRAVERAVGQGERPPSNRLDLSDGAKRVLEWSIEEAREMGHREIGTEHLLLGLAHEDEGIVANVMRGLRLDQAEVRAQARHYAIQDRPASDPNCVFCQIVAAEAPAEVLYQDELVTAFRDAHPQAPTHILVVPNHHVESLAGMGDEDAQVLGRIVTVTNHLAWSEGIAESGYRVINNVGPDSGQVVPHVHFHLLGGRRLGPLVAHR